MTITVAQMIEALSKLPQDAELVVTENGSYLQCVLALPRAASVTVTKPTK